MCDLGLKINRYIEKNQIAEEEEGSAFKWKPLKTRSGCQKCGAKASSECCAYQRLVDNFCMLLADFVSPIVDFVSPIVDPVSCHARIPKKNTELFKKFNEIDRITKSRKLVRKTKLGLIARPDVETIYKFLTDLITRAHVTLEILVSTMVIIDRFRELSGWELFSTTW
eukprot:CAMPEP_0114985708 /NCGR_PEP_ID=MMETSP0216-20121206/8017_1 /TAXON_ID=223996 /ORGANISM="Protocruzia adherens, Strain Boccale" /LENGTH=167 /DNA_ID=CAMNT_0002348055 /DNA_START=72 /DNA_END=572 /DNA_ORIENTATION=-